jgi:outer membrane biosynthesis protein TonB
MSTTAMTLDLEQCQRRTRWTMTVSAVFHAALMAGLVFAPHRSEQPPITEVTLIDPADPGTPGPTQEAAAPKGATETGVAASEPKDIHFRREPLDADRSMARETQDAFQDQLNSKLAALAHPAETPTPGVAVGAPTSVWGTSPATISAKGTGGSAPVALNRGGTGGPPIELSRGGIGNSPAPAMVTTKLTDKSAAQEAADGGQSTAHRTLAGAQLLGPIADRPILSYAKPVYPDWAKREAVEGSVTLYFIVRADGTVKENVVGRRPPASRNSTRAPSPHCARGASSPLRGGRAGEQWGTITFHFRLRETG